LKHFHHLIRCTVNQRSAESEQILNETKCEKKVNEPRMRMQQMGLLVLIVGSSATSAHCIAEMNPEMK